MSRTVEDIKEEIFNFYRVLSIPPRDGHMIQAQRLNQYYHELNNQEKENFKKAVSQLEDDGYINTASVVAGLEIFITKKGIEHIES